METILPMIIQAVSGVVGGGGIGALVRGVSMGGLGNTVVGALGGLAGGQLLSGPIGGLLGGATEVAADATAAAGDAAASGAMDGILTQVASGGIGGLGLTAIVGVVKNMMSRG